MNAWQMSQQIKHKLATVTWPDAAGEVVFGSRSVFVYAGGPPNEEELSPGFPFALVTIDSGTPDPDHPDLIEQQFSVMSVVEVAGDALGEHAVIGSSRANAGRSTGAGVAEVAERVRAALQFMTSYDGAHIIVNASGTGAPSTIGRGRHIAFDQFTVTAMCTSQPYYAAPERFTVAGGTATWVGAQCSSRYDFLRYRVGYVAGAIPVESPSDATIVYTGTATTATGVTGGGVYMVWADYSARGGGVVSASSDGRLIGAHFPRTWP